MSQPTVVRRKTFFMWSRVSAIAVVLFPLSLQHVDFRAAFAQGLSITAHKASPAYAALEDSREDYVSPPSSIPASARLIASGRRYDLNVINQVQRVRQVTMQGMTVRLPFRLEPKPIYVAGDVAPPRQMGRVSLPTQTKLDYSGKELSSAERRRRLVEELKHEDWSQPSPALLAQALVQEEESAGAANLFAGGAAPSGGGVSLGPSGSGGNKGLFSAAGAHSTIDSSPRELLFADNSSLQRDEVHKPFSAMMTRGGLNRRNPQPADMRPLWLSGQLEVTGGLAVVGPQTQLVIQRMFNGETFERGSIWVTEGKFEIRVKKPLGFLVAELRSSDGRVLGHGEINLMDLGPLPDKGDRINDLRIALSPTAEGASFRAVSGYSHGQQKIMVADARMEIQAYSDAQRVNGEGAISEPTLSRDSSFVARALAKDHWPTLIVGHAREPQEVRLFTNGLVDALINLNATGNERKEARRLGVVWGEVKQLGELVRGAQVEMAGDYQPIYFNEAYIPDPNLHATTSNGLFAFVRVRPGVQALRLRIGSRLYSSQVFPTEDKHVSYVEIVARDKVISQFRVFDGLRLDKPVMARIRLVGTDEVLEVNKEDFVEYAVAANPFWVEADAGGEFEISRVTVTGSPHVVNVPVVSRQWLYQLSNDAKITADVRRGTIVGYMDHHDFEVELTGYLPGENMQIVYFDAQGRTVDRKVGMAGGGFVIFNAPVGLQTLYIHPAQSRATFSQIVVAEPEFVQVVTH